ncbi:putative cytochrome P450 6a13 [Cercospora beticola]|uniref:Putative cytochrome P450 6a13 n=1 Tax=Cercospora beticola TaxID=122368 RepID=A0A2G5I6K2_CERBT|nr:putative cytochrome P450 6a13 [Cercospora beticola]PIB00421.1 putative cytochrome P450 6a13 [Cercospora beticola]WPA97535.1 hypothetical protein RHO25_002145 [Cercospora beticola]CAK1354006.1 unnamed protein product [Cercospora beticola]
MTNVPALDPATVLAVAIIALSLLLISSYLTTNDWTQSIPQAPQAPIWRRFFIEPDHDQRKAWADSVPNSGLILYRGMFNKPKILLTTPAAIQEVYQRGAANSRRRPPEATETSPTDVYTPTDQESVSALLGQTQELVNLLHKAAATDSRVEISELINRTTLDIVGQAGFGLDFDCLANPDNDLWKEYAAVFRGEGNGARAGLAWTMLAHLLPGKIVEKFPTKRNEQTAKAVEVVRRRIGGVIAKKKAEILASAEVGRKDSIVDRDEGEEASNLSKAAIGEGHNDIISACISEGGITDFEMLVNQALGILGAGHETIAQTICLAIFELSKDKTLQTRVRAEIKEHIQSKEDSSSLAATHLDLITSIPLLTAICNETLRLHPIIPALAREPTPSVNLLGHQISQGTVLIIVQKVFNHNPSLWSQDPSQFLPTRWISDPTGGAKERLAFMTFGEGPTMCIGEKMARAEMAIVLAGLIREFEMEYVGQGRDGQRQKLEFDWGGCVDD